MKEKIIKTYHLFNSLEGSLFRYSLSYTLLLALFPGLTAIIMLYQASLLDTKPLLDFVYKYLPYELVSPFVQYLFNKGDSTYWSMIFSFLVAGYVASQCVYSFLLFSADHENYETRNIFIRIKAVILFFLYILTFLIFAIGAYLFSDLLNVIVIIGIFTLLNFFYKSLSFQKRGKLFGLLGAGFSTLSISLVGSLFFVIVKRFTNYESVYGPLSSLMVLFLSIYVIANLIFFGYCLNLNFYPQSKKIIYKHQRISKYLKMRH